MSYKKTITLPYKDVMNDHVNVFFLDRWGHISVRWCPNKEQAKKFILKLKEEESTLTEKLT